MNGIIYRIVFSLLGISAYGYINRVLNDVATLALGKATVNQFEDSDSAYMLTMSSFDFFMHIGLPFFVLLAVLLAIWWKPIKGLFSAPEDTTKKLVFAFLALSTTAAMVVPEKAQAYYDKNDYTEAYFVMPNETAFYIPDVGANKTSQGQFGSEEYLAANKVAAKRIVLPHAKLSGSGMFNDYYVPSGRLIVVSRLPYTGEWTKTDGRGTTAKNESFECQTKEGINVTLEVSIGADILPGSEAKYLYYYGISQPKGDRSDPVIIFQSVYQATSLAEVMEKKGHSYIGRALCKYVSPLTLDEANGQATKIIDSVEKDAKAYFLTRGISIDYVGWAGTFEFDKDVQKAINDSYVAAKVAPHTSVLSQLADIKVKEGLAIGFQKGISFLPEGLVKFFTNTFSSGSPAPAKSK